MSDKLAVFVPKAGKEFGDQVCLHLGISAFPHEERDFEDGEHKTRPLESVRGKDVFVIQSLYGDANQSVNDRLCRLLFFIAALRDASARQVTAVVPYLCYSRKDRRSKLRDPVTSRYIAELFEAVGTGRVVTMDVHNLAAFQNAFRIPAEHLEAKDLFVEYFAPLGEKKEIVVVSPDAGGVKRAEAFRESLQAKLGRPIASAFIEKYRSAGVVTGEAVVGSVAGKAAIIIDDLISTGTTLSRAAHACRQQGATEVYAAITHGVFTSDANRVVREAPFDKIVVTNTIPPFRLEKALIQDRVVILDTTPLVAGAIRRIHGEMPPVEMD